MSVLARKRNLSKYEFYNNAVRLRKQIVLFLLRDFGAKKVRNVKIDTGKMEPQDADLLLGVMEKYHITKFPGEYPDWLLEKLRDSIWQCLLDLVSNITTAYSIWATNSSEAELRRLSQDKAIAACERLYKEFELAIELLPTDVQKYMPYVESIEREIALLKGWRKKDNRRKKAEA